MEILLYIIKLLVTILLIIVLGILIVSLLNRKSSHKGEKSNNISIKLLNDEYRKLVRSINELDLSQDADKKDKKNKKKYKFFFRRDKEIDDPKKASKDDKAQERLFVIDFKGDLQASNTAILAKQISVLISTIQKGKDQVLIVLDSPGGTVNGYGYAASQLARLRQHGIKLTVAVDQMAASGGYMMAAVADKIVAAPFAYLGSIGVVAQIPNIHRLLKDNKVDIELITAGKYKRTLTILGENTEEGRHKFQQNLEQIHHQFKEHVLQYRPQLDIEQVATGEVWLGEKALKIGLCDEISTSEDLILQAINHNKLVYKLQATNKKNLLSRLSSSIEQGIISAWEKLIWRNYY